MPQEKVILEAYDEFTAANETIVVDGGSSSEESLSIKPTPPSRSPQQVTMADISGGSRVVKQRKLVDIEVNLFGKVNEVDNDKS